MDLYLSVILILLPSVMAWPEGAPYKMCLSRHPKHQARDQQATEPPYQITTNRAVYQGGEEIEVTLESKPVAGGTPVPFKGFQINARRVEGDTEECLGEFKLPINPVETNVRLQFWYPEKADIFNCATHLNSRLKTSVRLIWKSTSAQGYGDIVFRAGFVKNYETFWSDVNSQVIRQEGKTVVKSSAAPTADPELLTFDTKDCGNTVGCFLSPPQCSGLGCDYGVQYKYLSDSNSVAFQLLGPGKDQYVTLALSEDQFMGQDETVTCYLTENFQGIQKGYNPKRYNDWHRNIDITNVAVSKTDDRLVCSFVRPMESTLMLIEEDHSNYDGITKSNKTFLLSDKSYLQLASGELMKDSAVIRKHNVLPIMSGKPMNFLEPELNYGTSLPLYIKFHGLLGYLAWISLSSVGMLLARHCKQIIPKQGLWFKLHRGTMLTVLIIAVIAIIIVFASVGQWSQVACNHAVLGLITTGLASVQILFGLLRPDLSAPRRPLFNWGHFFTAIVTQILAITTLILGTQVSLLNLRLSQWLCGVVVVSVALHLVILFILEVVEKCLQKKDLNASSDPSSGGSILDQNKDQMQMEDPTKKKISRSNEIKKIVMKVFGFVVILELIIFAAFIFAL